MVQHLDPSLNFGQVRRVLRGFVGTVPTYPAAFHERKPVKVDRAPAERWVHRPEGPEGVTSARYLGLFSTLLARDVSS